MKNKINLPIIISLLRLPCAFLILYYYESYLKYLFFVVAILCDFLDGFIARRWKQATKLGAIIDPIVDKFFTLIICVYLFILLKLPVYYLLFFFIRDIFTILEVIFIYINKSKIEIKARFLGKIATNLQFIVLFLMIIGNLSLIKIGMYLLFIISLISIGDYIIHFKKNK